MWYTAAVVRHTPKNITKSIERRSFNVHIVIVLSSRIAVNTVGGRTQSSQRLRTVRERKTLAEIDACSVLGIIFFNYFFHCKCSGVPETRWFLFFFLSRSSRPSTPTRRIPVFQFRRVCAIFPTTSRRSFPSRVFFGFSRSDSNRTIVLLWVLWRSAHLLFFFFWICVTPPPFKTKIKKSSMP